MASRSGQSRRVDRGLRNLDGRRFAITHPAIRGFAVDSAANRPTKCGGAGATMTIEPDDRTIEIDGQEAVDLRADHIAGISGSPGTG